MDEHDLKALTTKSRLAKVEAKKCRQRLSSYDEQIAKLLELRLITMEQIATAERTIKDVSATIEKNMDGQPAVISEHAILRYLERVWGIDMEFIKSMIVPKDVEEVIMKLGQNGQFPVKSHPAAPHNHKVRVRNNVVVSVYAKECENEAIDERPRNGRKADRSGLD